MNSVVSMSMEASRGNLYLLTIIFWFEILFFLIIYDFVIIETHGFISYYLHELGQFTVRMKKVGITLYIIRLNYYLLRLTRILRLGWVTYGSGEKSSVWLGISKFSLSQILLIIFKNIISVPMILAFLFASFLLKAVRGDISYYLSKLQEPLKGILQIKIDIGDVFLRLPALVSLMTILPIVFFFYFHSQKREVRKIIDNENSQYFEEVVLLYEKLLIWIDQHIYQISKNFDYVINCQDSIVELFLEKAIPNYMSLTRKQYYIPVSIEHFRFIEIADLNELQEIIAKLSSDRLIRFTRTFSVKRFDIWYLYFWEFRSFSKIEQIEEFFYTQKGMITKLAMCNKYLYDFTQVQLEKERKDEQLRLSCSIYNDLKLLYKLKRTSDSLRTYLYSSRMERLILKALKKDK
ncbi:hypothetical protein [Streptococcus danieliae]|uniref:hypothetical protein n=1 Tax=Streptococcus danieliae TaxID=747656 RepID=UPI0026EAEC85|nr:hypothetical protein [Streptococcus danieliae]